MFYTQALYVQSLTETHVDLLYSVVTNHETRLWALYIVKFDTVFFTSTRFWQSFLNALKKSFVTHFYCEKDTIPRYWTGKIWDVLRSNRRKHTWYVNSVVEQEVKISMW